SLGANTAAANANAAAPGAAAAAPDDKPAEPRVDDKAPAAPPSIALGDKAAPAGAQASNDKVDDKPAAVPPATSDKTAAQEKKDAQAFLERGKIQDSIDAGERSVALDPSDGEAWLILGAAYQMKGKAAEARRCFLSCMKEGKRGPVRECQAMLR